MHLNSSSEGRSSAVDCFTLAATPFQGTGAAAGAVFSHTLRNTALAALAANTAICYTE